MRLPEIDREGEALGFRVGSRGTMTSRTIMLSELRALLARLPAAAAAPEYRAAIIEQNVLFKKTAATRRLTAQRLSELYGLDPGIMVFRVMRELWDLDEEGHPLLACLCANARDPILRLTAGAVLPAHEGQHVPTEAIAEAVGSATGDRFNPSTLNKIGRNAASSWTQSGHLSGRSHKIRSLAAATPAATAYSLLLGCLTGARGVSLFQTYWASLLDVSADRIDQLAFQASRRGLIDYQRIGNVVEIGFSGLLTSRELEALREQA